MPPGPNRHFQTLNDDAFRQHVANRAEALILARTGNRQEAMIAFDVNGQEVLSKLGRAAEIPFTREEIRLLTRNAYLVVHNHDDDTPPSEEDLIFLAGVGAQELVAFGGTIRCRLRREPGWPPTHQLLTAFHRVDRLVARSLYHDLQTGRYSGDPYLWPDRSSHVWDRFQREFPEWFTLIRVER